MVGPYGSFLFMMTAVLPILTWYCDHVASPGVAVWLSWFPSPAISPPGTSARCATVMTTTMASQAIGVQESTDG